MYYIYRCFVRMFKVSGSYQMYYNGAESNQLPDGGRVGDWVGVVNKSELVAF
jgi:hypothetical protein